MKVLFAVSNDSISEAIIKRYPKEYRELLSYKNVYYFNAILKEIQNDKSYDRIVISEDLEPFVNTNVDSIDNFIFDHLDKISDEAGGDDGKEMSIILICSERRTLGSSILNKLFSIGIYNALIGNDRNMTELCKLINRPRTKKEAKLYYRIDQATYDPAADSGEVSENEIQNILNHFKKLGKNTDRYADSFNNIAAQYTDEQLKLIINVLPMKVKAVLESESEKYQALMGTSASTSSRQNSQGVMEPGIKVNAIRSNSNINGPIVIPSGVKRFSSGTQSETQNVIARASSNVNNVNQVRPVVPKAVEPNNVVKVQRQPVEPNIQEPVQRTVPGVSSESRRTVDGAVNTERKIPQPVRVEPVKQEQPRVQPVQTQSQNQPRVQQVQAQVQNQARVQQVQPVQTQTQAVAQGQTGNVQKQAQRYTGTIAQVKRTLSAKRPAVANRNTNSIQPVPQANVFEESNSNDDFSALLDGLETVAPVQDDSQEKRGRGRPKKPVSELESQKPKGKRGRPKKNPDAVEDNLNDLLNPLSPSTSDDILPGLEETADNSLLPGLEDIDSSFETNEEVLPSLDRIDDGMLPGLDSSADDGMLPGLDSAEDGMLPGLDSTDDGVLPGLDNSNDGTFPSLDIDEEEGEEVDVSSLLSGLDDDDNNASLPGLDDMDDGILPGLDSTNAGMLQGLNSADDDMLPGLDSTDDLLPGLDDDLLPGVDDNNNVIQNSNPINNNTISGYENDSFDDGLLPGLDEEETLLPGMGFEDEKEEIKPNQEFSNSQSTTQASAIESIKPKIDYSMSNLSSLLTKDKKIVTFLGTTKNGTSFLVNNLALMFSLMGIDTAILDMTQNRNSYYLFTDNRNDLRNIAFSSISKLESGYAEGIKFNKNLTVYTSLPSDGNVYDNSEAILSTLVQNHSLILIDCDFSTPPAYFASCQEIYLVQSMDILTIQPLTTFIRDLKFKGAWEPEKARVVINKELPVKILNNKMIIGGLSKYNGPDMSVMTDLFNKDMIKACSIPFDEKVYSKYLETMATCKLSLNGYSKQFMSKLQILGEMVYPRLNAKKSYGPSPTQNYGNNGVTSGNTFSSSTNSTLNKMKNKY